MLACGKGLNLDEAKVNVNGGVVALGHPVSDASGARVLVTLLYALKRHNKRYGLGLAVLGRRQRRRDDCGAGVVMAVRKVARGASLLMEWNTAGRIASGRPVGSNLIMPVR